MVNAMENDPFEPFPSGPREDQRSLRIYLMDQQREVAIRRPKDYTLEHVLATIGYLGEQYPKGTLTTGDGMMDISVRMSVENFCNNWAGYARLVCTLSDERNLTLHHQRMADLDILKMVIVVVMVMAMIVVILVMSYASRHTLLPDAKVELGFTLPFGVGLVS